MVFHKPWQSAQLQCYNNKFISGDLIITVIRVQLLCQTINSSQIIRVMGEQSRCHNSSCSTMWYYNNPVIWVISLSQCIIEDRTPSYSSLKKICYKSVLLIYLHPSPHQLIYLCFVWPSRNLCKFILCFYTALVLLTRVVINEWLSDWFGKKVKLNRIAVKLY